MSMLAAFACPVGISPEAYQVPAYRGDQISLFRFAWTANKTQWISPVISGSFFGMGMTWM